MKPENSQQKNRSSLKQSRSADDKRRRNRAAAKVAKQRQAKAGIQRQDDQPLDESSQTSSE